MPFTYRRNMAGGNYPPEIRVMTVAANQTLVRGDAVSLSSGNVTKTGATAGRIAGIMAEAVTTGSGVTAEAQVRVITPSQVWRGTANANAASRRSQRYTHIRFERCPAGKHFGYHGRQPGDCRHTGQQH